MGNKKYTPNQLNEFVNEVTYTEIYCSGCRVHKERYMDEDSFTEEVFKEGWRATKENVYCPKCAKKKLKQ